MCGLAARNNLLVLHILLAIVTLLQLAFAFFLFYAAGWNFLGASLLFVNVCGICVVITGLLGRFASGGCSSCTQGGKAFSLFYFSFLGSYTWDTVLFFSTFFLSASARQAYLWRLLYLTLPPPPSFCFLPPLYSLISPSSTSYLPLLTSLTYLPPGLIKWQAILSIPMALATGALTMLYCLTLFSLFHLDFGSLSGAVTALTVAQLLICLGQTIGYGFSTGLGFWVLKEGEGERGEVALEVVVNEERGGTREVELSLESSSEEYRDRGYTYEVERSDNNGW
jgi:hypothetical protein